jgi:hypothetical protein
MADPRLARLRAAVEQLQRIPRPVIRRAGVSEEWWVRLDDVLASIDREEHP